MRARRPARKLWERRVSGERDEQRAGAKRTSRQWQAPERSWAIRGRCARTRYQAHGALAPIVGTPEMAGTHSGMGGDCEHDRRDSDSVALQVDGAIDAAGRAARIGNGADVGAGIEGRLGAQRSSERPAGNENVRRVVRRGAEEPNSSGRTHNEIPPARGIS